MASLVTSGSVEQLAGHLRLAMQNGLTEAELKEAIVHLAFYASWPRAMSSIQVAKQVFAERSLLSVTHRCCLTECATCA